MIGCCGICYKDKTGTTHHIIIGLGVVSVPDVNREDTVKVVRSQALGVSIANQPGLAFAAGIASNSVVAVPNGLRDVCAEVSQRPFGSIEVKTCDSQNFHVNN